MPHYTRSVILIWESGVKILPRLFRVVAVFVPGISSLDVPSVVDDVH
jgi:hypothetical protein